MLSILSAPYKTKSILAGVFLVLVLVVSGGIYGTLFDRPPKTVVTKQDNSIERIIANQNSTLEKINIENQRVITLIKEVNQDRHNNINTKTVQTIERFNPVYIKDPQKSNSGKIGVSHARLPYPEEIPDTPVVSPIPLPLTPTMPPVDSLVDTGGVSQIGSGIIDPVITPSEIITTTTETRDTSNVSTHEVSTSGEASTGHSSTVKTSTGTSQDTTLSHSGSSTTTTTAAGSSADPGLKKMGLGVTAYGSSVLTYNVANAYLGPRVFKLGTIGGGLFVDHYSDLNRFDFGPQVQYSKNGFFIGTGLEIVNKRKIIMFGVKF